ncbi:patatin-like phospholipase family protein [Budvicia diplopodorum]|uniref:patatin-like phospholipase family protein n=1 Tax=Budvicia diplopodorum TaxID=1119056 RepID=UPI0013573567|nr:patatin-like phospholipase family protein [Budvicia diplopodorum]
MSYNFSNLVFEGGGVKSVAYLGAFEVLTKRGIINNIIRTGGTSSGALWATIISLGYTLEEAEKILWDLDFSEFMDDTWGVVRDTNRLLSKFGWYQGEYLRSWIGDLIGRKTGNSEATFYDMDIMKKEKGFKLLYLIGTNLSTSSQEIFSAEHTPQMIVADAMRISMSIPLFFVPINSQRGDVYIDGGVVNNYPIKLFDSRRYIYTTCRLPKRFTSNSIYNEETLGFRLDTKEEISNFRNNINEHAKINNIIDYAQALVHTVLDAQELSHALSDDKQRTIYIDTLDVKTTDFHLTDENKIALVKSGRECTEDYFRWYDRKIR